MTDRKERNIWIGLVEVHQESMAGVLGDDKVVDHILVEVSEHVDVVQAEEGRPALCHLHCSRFKIYLLEKMYVLEVFFSSIFMFLII